MTGRKDFCSEIMASDKNIPMKRDFPFIDNKIPLTPLLHQRKSVCFLHGSHKRGILIEKRIPGTPRKGLEAEIQTGVCSTGATQVGRPTGWEKHSRLPENLLAAGTQAEYQLSIGRCSGAAGSDALEFPNRATRNSQTHSTLPVIFLFIW